MNCPGGTEQGAANRICENFHKLNFHMQLVPFSTTQ